MGLNEYLTPDRHEQFLEAITTSSIHTDDVDSKANTYLIAGGPRVWYRHAGAGFAGISKKTRDSLTTVDDRSMVHLFVLRSIPEFEEFVAANEGVLAEKANDIKWFALPDEKLNQYSTAGSKNKLNVNDGDFSNMSKFRHDVQEVLQ